MGKLSYPFITDVMLFQRLIAFPLSGVSVWTRLTGVSALLYPVPLHSCVFLRGLFGLFHW